MPRLLSRGALVAAAATIAVVATTGVVVADSHVGGSDNPWPYAADRAYTLAAVGDIACEPNTPDNAAVAAKYKCGSASLGGSDAQFATADQVESLHPDLVALLGDEQYEVGKLSDFENSFDQSYGAFKFLQRPAPGNHEFYAYKSGEAAQNGTGYFQYFNGRTESGATRPEGQAGESGQGWYSYDLGSWHVIALNIECNSAAFGNNCDPTTGVLGQETSWLARDLAADHSSCTLAYWHQPTFSASDDPSTEGQAADAWWKLLYRSGADVVLNGHEHYYARFAPQTPDGTADPHHGIAQFIIGSGGESLDTLSRAADGSLSAPNLVTGEDTAYGVESFQLGQNGYSWDFRPVLAGSGQPASVLDYRDSGSATCHGPAPR